MNRTVLVFVITAVCVAAGVRAQQARPPAPAQPGAQPPVTFRVEIDYVEVDAVVTDQAGNFVRDLQKSDFQVFEDQKPQNVTVFSHIDIPIERAEQPLFAERPVEPDVWSNQEPFGGRLYVIILDDLHTNALRSQRVKVAARRFIERYLGANDLAAVVHTSGRTDAGQELTSSKRLLVAAVDKFMGQKLPSATAERTDAYFRQQDLNRQVDRIDDPSDMERGYKARMTYDVLKNVAGWLNGIRGRRKAVLFLSEGIDYDIYDIFNARSASTVLDQVRDTIATATRSNVNIYTVDPRGLTSLGDESIEIQSFPDDTSLGIGVPSQQQELRLAQDSLRVLADQTGGFAAVNANDFTDAFERVVRENSSYYVLGYYPTNTRRDGKFRKIEVRVARPGLVARARKGYVAPTGRAPQPRPAATADRMPAELREALDNPLPVSGLTLFTSAAPFKGAGSNASVAVIAQLEGADLKFTTQDEIHANHIEVSFMAVDSKGKVAKADRAAADMKLKPQTYEAVSQSGLRVMSRLELAPGRYQLRVGAYESGSGSTGSVHYMLEVPDFAKLPFSMSGLVVGSAHGARVPTARPDEEFKQVLPVPPTTAREFAADDTLVLFVEIYDNEAATAHTVDISTTVRTDSGTVVFKHDAERSTKEFQAARGGFGHTVQVPLGDFKPGLHTLRVEARSRLGDGPTAARELLFRVR